MVYLVETLASVDVMVHQLVDHLNGGDHNALLGISWFSGDGDIKRAIALLNIFLLWLLYLPAPWKCRRLSAGRSGGAGW
jgi:hypothetical protein